VAASYASPSAVSLTGSSRYLAVVEANDETVQFQAIDSQSGKHLAAIDPGAYHFWRNPLILGDTFFSYDDFDGWLYAWRLPGGEPLYRLRFGTQAAAEIMALDPQTVCAVDAPSGRIRWRSRLSLESIDRGPLLAKGAILYPYRYRPVPVGEPAYDKPGPFFRAARGILALDAQSGAKLADIDLMKLLDERTIQDIREVFYADDHLFLVTHTGRTFKLRLDLPRP
jgi:hypothetical protein